MPADGKRRAAEARGRQAERRAALWLRLKGYSILASRVKLPVGEIDLIARAAEAWMGQRPRFADFGWRYDLMMLAPGRLPGHLKDAWRPGLA